MIIVIIYLNIFFQILSSQELCNHYSVIYPENLKKFRENCDNEHYLIVYNKNDIDLNKHKNVQFALISGKDVKNALYVNELNYLKELYLLNTNVNDLDKIKESINVYVIDKRFYLNNKYKKNITFFDPLLYTPYTTHVDFDDLETIYKKIYKVHLSEPHSDEPGLTFFKEEIYSYNFDLIQFVDTNYILSLNDVINKNLFGLIKNKLWKYAKYLIEYYEVDLNKTDNNKTILDYIYEIKNGNDINYYLKIRNKDFVYYYQNITEYSKENIDIKINNSKQNNEFLLINYLKNKYKDINSEYFQIYMQDIRPNNFKHYDNMPLIKYLKDKDKNNK